MSRNDTKPQPSGMDLVIAGVCTGGFIEIANCIRKEENYKILLKYMRSYPGLSFGVTTSIIGCGFIFKETFRNTYQNIKTIFFRNN